LGKDKNLISPFFQSFDKIDQERGLSNVMRMGRKGRSNDTDVHYLVLVMVNSDGKFG
jgi:hypothetical protein